MNFNSFYQENVLLAVTNLTDVEANVKKKKTTFKKRNIAGVESADKWWNKKDYTFSALGLMEVLAKDLQWSARDRRQTSESLTWNCGGGIIKCLS